MSESLEAMFKQRGDYWKNEADKYRSVVEWLGENMPRALELCPYKAVPQQPSDLRRSEGDAIDP